MSIAVNLVNLENAINETIINSVKPETLEKVARINEKATKAIDEMNTTKKIILDKEIYMYLYELASYDNYYLMGCFCSGMTEKGGYKRQEKTLKIVVMTGSELLANTNEFFNNISNSSKKDLKRDGMEKTIKLRSSGFRKYVELHGFELLIDDKPITEKQFNIMVNNSGINQGYYFENLLVTCFNGELNEISNAEFTKAPDLIVKGWGFQAKIFSSKMSTFGVIERKLVEMGILPDDLKQWKYGDFSPISTKKKQFRSLSNCIRIFNKVYNFCAKCRNENF